MKLSVIILAKDEEKVIEDCLESVHQLADEIVLVDTGSTDRTPEIAKKFGAKVISVYRGKLEFSRWRNEGLKTANGEWILYLDADERITPELKREMQKVIRDKQYDAYAIPRRNFYLGKEVRFGGARPDYVKRLFRKDKLQKWKGRLHEEPVYEGELGYLKEPMIHLTHRDLSSMVEKTREWSKIEAELLYEANHPPVTWWRILRIMLGEFYKRGIRLQGWRDGMVGWIEIIFQVFSRFITYARLWEIQVKKEK